MNDLPTFDKLRISTITAIAHLSSNVDYKSLFYRLPCIDKDEKPGDIIALSHTNLQRGKLVSKRSSFKNTTTLSMCNQNGKRVSVKISNNKIHMCGLTSDDDAKFITERLVKYINELTPDESPVMVTSIENSMVNYSYKLGFKVNRMMLRKLIDGRDDFIASYNNIVNGPVTIRLPININPYQTIGNNRKRQRYHTFTVHRSGSVTQSSPTIPLAQEAYERFRRIISEVRPQIDDGLNQR
jgi:hypothetical protein